MLTGTDVVELEVVVVVVNVWWMLTGTGGLRARDEGWQGQLSSILILKKYKE
jgi:hypothetical protein